MSESTLKDPVATAVIPESSVDGTIRILVADDAANIRFGLCKLLEKWGYTVFGAADGEEAWSILNEQNIQMVISDWMMPECNGVELCERIRQQRAGRYTYFILLTSRDDDGALVEGMTAGADDYLNKPFAQDELRVRIKAGQRILELEQALDTRNRELSELNSALSSAYQTIEQDLRAAAEIQMNLLPKKSLEKNSLGFDWLYIPSAFVGGDLLNFVDLGDGNTLFYNFDISGHGVQAAMLSVSIAKILNPDFCREYGRNHSETHYCSAAIVTALNERFQSTDLDARYFTIALGIYAESTSRVTLCQAGHTHPIHIDRQGRITPLGEGGFPVGMLADMTYSSVTRELQPGDRIFLHSDGITECENSDGEQFGVDRLQKVIAENIEQSLDVSIENIKSSILSWHGSTRVDDDVSLLGVEYR